MRLKFNFSELLLGIGMILPGSQALAQATTCFVPLDEKQSAPAIDLIQNGHSVDRDLILDQILNGLDSSTLEPQISDLYSGKDLPFVQYAEMPYPGPQDSLNFVKELGSASGLLFTRATLSSHPEIAYQLNFSIDMHPALARNALLRKLGYAIPSPKYYSKIKVTFPSLDVRNTFLDHLATIVGDIPSYRFVEGGQDEIKKNNVSLTLQDIVLEPAIIEVPQLHWGIFVQSQTVDTLQSRRSIRALLVPLTLLEFQQSVNMTSFEAAKIYNSGINFTRENANLFNNETSIGDVRWIAKKIAKLTRADWTAIIQAAHYPADVQALLIEKTIGRADQFLGILGLSSYTPIPYDEFITNGNVINGKETKEFYDTYVPRFTYGDPTNPLRASELFRYFGVQAISGALGDVLDKANQYLQAVTPAQYIAEHNQDFINQLIAHLQSNPNQPFVEPIKVWGGPVENGAIQASRNIITGTYYGSDSQIQLVDSVSVAATAGLFLGVSGFKSVGVSIDPSISYSRSYVHVSPISDISTAWKEKWTELFVPSFMSGLAKTLQGKSNEDATASVSAFFAKMNVGEMFIITDAFSGGVSGQAAIPVGALIGVTPLASLSVDVGVGDQYVILSRTTITRTKNGFQVYLSRIHTGAFETQLDVQYYVKLLSLANTFSNGKADTRTYIFPDTFDSNDQAKLFQKSLVSLLRANDPGLIEENFEPYTIEHQNKGTKTKLNFGPWTWSKRENFHALQVTPPVDPSGKYTASDFTRTAVKGQITRLTGADYIDFFSSIVKNFVSWFNFGSKSVGADPASGFLGTSKSFSISTEIETTPGRANNTFTMLQEVHTGWTLSQKGLLKMVKKIASELGSYNPSGGLIDTSEFSQTKKLQAYTILWNMLIYEQGLNRMTNLLDLNSLSTIKATQFMVSLIGMDQYQTYCDDHQLSADVSVGPYQFEDESDHSGMVIESSQGQTTLVSCVLPWMQTVFDLRASLSGHPAAFKHSVATQDEAKEKIRWINRSLNTLTHDLKLQELISLVGKENAFFQVRVSGFRTKDERALDENFNANYFSNTIGVIDQNVLSGPLSDIESASGISSNEIEAGYLTDGY